METRLSEVAASSTALREEHTVEGAAPHAELMSRLREGLQNATSTRQCTMYIKQGRSTGWEQMDRRYLDSALKEPDSFTDEYLAKVAKVQFSLGDRMVLAIQLAEKTSFTDANGTVEVSESRPACWLNAKRFLTVDEASRYEYAGSTALKLATTYVAQPSNGVVTRVVQASNGYFYPCGENDISINI